MSQANLSNENAPLVVLETLLGRNSMLQLLLITKRRLDGSTGDEALELIQRLLVRTSMDAVVTANIIGIF
jgi:hypothetical protein